MQWIQFVCWHVSVISLRKLFSRYALTEKVSVALTRASKPAFPALQTLRHSNQCNKCSSENVHSSLRACETSAGACEKVSARWTAHKQKYRRALRNYSEIGAFHDPVHLSVLAQIASSEANYLTIGDFTVRDLYGHLQSDRPQADNKLAK